jgi:ABC-type nitrate/sulfonate/bicarbonate transport system substrate-binding protein
MDLWDAETLGYTDPASWEEMQDALLAIGYIPEPIDLSAAYTNAFVPLVED